MLCATVAAHATPPKAPVQTPLVPAMARHQLFFAGVDPEPILVALIIKTLRHDKEVSLEAKAFVAWKGKWQTPFWEKVKLRTWPGTTLSRAAAAWQAGHSKGKLRLSVSEGDGGLKLSIRRPQGGLEISARGLRPAGKGMDPHGAVSWRSARARLLLNGRRFKGRLIAEQLPRATTPWPRFGRFEMWLRLLPDGGMMLGRARFAAIKGSGSALWIPAAGAPRTTPFEVHGASTRRERDSGYALPIGWRLGGKVPGLLRRVGGEVGRGAAQGGGKAVYDISLAVGDGGPLKGGMALVFHLQDAKVVAPGRPKAQHPRP